MDWAQIFSMDTLSKLAWPVGLGIIIAAALYFLRLFLYRYIHRLAAKTKTTLDDIMVRETRLATLLWCLWLGVYSGYRLADTPVEWVDSEHKIISVLFVTFGIYTAISIIMGFFKWYKDEICPRTSSSLDDLIMGTLIAGTPIVGGGLGVIAILNILMKDNTRIIAIDGWLEEHGLKIGILIVVAVTVLMLLVLVVPRIIDRAVRNAKSEQTEEEMKKRSDTLVSVIVTTLQVSVIFMFIMMILTEVNINVTSVIAGASVLGLAVGFGAQSLVKDTISGLFIIMENQYRKGDVVALAGVSGVVEEINLRRTILRDTDGTYHVVPNGQINVSSNYTKQLSKVNMVISVAYDTDLEKAIAVINRVGKEMAEDPVWANCITNPPKALRVDNLGESGIDIRIAGETKPSRQWEVSGELRLRLKKAFDKEGIDIPYPHTKVIFGNQPLQVKYDTPRVTEIKVDTTKTEGIQTDNKQNN